jgi:hypothetical protein
LKQPRDSALKQPRDSALKHATLRPLPISSSLPCRIIY